MRYIVGFIIGCWAGYKLRKGIEAVPKFTDVFKASEEEVKTE